MARKNSKNTANALNSTLTLAELGARYIAQMEEQGKSVGTCFSYLMELKLAQSELGGETLVSALTSDAIAKFNTCSRVMKLKTGRAKSQLSIDKTRRVLRLALTWAHQAGLVAEAIVDPKTDTLPGASDVGATDAADAKPARNAKTAKKTKHAPKSTKPKLAPEVALVVPQAEAEAAADEVEAQLASESITNEPTAA
ncbi:MAG: hypothetical protein IPK60_20885 [Sandaracinaceae bacterium]|nr:hypothetical protein [Sandaracinaceae bacterium]